MVRAHRYSAAAHCLVAVIALAALGASCSKTASPPTAFGVNLTIDGHALDASVLSAGIGLTLDVSGAETKSFTLSGDYTNALKNDKVVRFRFIPVVMTGSLDLTVTGTGAGSTVVATGSAKGVTLQTTAVNVTITLAGTTGDGGPSDGPVVVNDGGASNGTTCTSGDTCASGVCSDGVCCDKACDGVCESCNVSATTKGTCTAIPENTDPDMECAEKVAVAPTDTGDASAEAGASDASTEAGASEAGASDSGAADSGTESDAEVINTPDGGFMTTKGACGGTCNGARACKYPGTEKSCGKPFCNDRRDVGSFVCDGNGSCGTALTACSDYACDETKASCHTNCAGPDDCLLTDYCAADGTCKPKKVISVACGTDGECKTDHCSNGVCCNTACTGTGLSCNDPGQAGQCKCQGVTCAAGVACQIFYKDGDADTYGDMSGTIANGRAVAGCMGSTPPAGFVVDNTDCDDTDANAHPGQTTFFAVQRKSGGFDYDCDNKLTKSVPEYVGGSCKFCGAVGSCDATSTTCSSTSQTASFQCPQEGSGVIIRPEPVQTASLSEPVDVTVVKSSLATSSAGTTAATSPTTICKACILSCCGCATNDKSGFLQTVACGDATHYAYTCGSCSAVGGGPLTSSALRQQTCR
ncbi:MAG TPA: hypothetical protein VHJ20_24460 [Polyangia bacterium]|nr:hypothetical protein [Polyangia bacterium]